MVLGDLLAPVHHQLQNILEMLLAEWDGIWVDVVTFEGGIE